MDIAQECSVSKIRDRNAALGAIVPKILGIVRARGRKLHDFGGGAPFSSPKLSFCQHILWTLIAS
jgi:hypothetical protein